MPLLLIRAGEFPAANITSEWFFARVRPYMGGEVVAPGKSPHAYSALERFLTRMDADVTGQLIRPREAPVTIGDGAGIWPFVDWGFTRPVGIFSGPYGHQPYWHVALLIYLLRK